MTAILMNRYYVYIMTNNSRTLYTGVTNNLDRRVVEHQNKAVPGFTRRYNITRLAYFEEFGDIREAIAREKQIKGWLRARKIELIESMNPHWEDLSDPGGRPEPAGRFVGHGDSDPILRCAQNDSVSSRTDAVGALNDGIARPSGRFEGRGSSD